MKKTILVFLFVAYCFTTLLSQHLTPIQEKVVRNTMAAQFGAIDKTRIFNLGKDVFCILGSDTFYNPDGFNYVFKLQHDSIKRLDCSVYHSSNHRRFLFAYDGELCALGGYGFFTTNNNLQVFNPNVKEWLFKSTSGDVPSYINGLSFKIGDEIYNMNNFKSGNSTSPDLIDSSIYKLDLKKMVWQRFYQSDYPSKKIGMAFYTDNYNLIIGDFQTIIVKPSEFKFLLLHNDVFGFTLSTAIDSISHDALFVFSSGSSNNNKLQYKLDLNKIWNKHIDNAKLFNLKPFEKIKVEDGLNIWFIISILLMGVILIGYFLMKRRPTNTLEIVNDAIPNEGVIETPKEQIAPEYLYSTLMQSEKTFLTSDELDDLFGISHLEPDSKKSKRHRYLSELETNHPGFIIRTKDQIDKRRFNYKIVR